MRKNVPEKGFSDQASSGAVDPLGKRPIVSLAPTKFTLWEHPLADHFPHRGSGMDENTLPHIWAPPATPFASGVARLPSLLEVLPGNAPPPLSTWGATAPDHLDAYDRAERYGESLCIGCPSPLASGFTRPRGLPPPAEGGGWAVQKGPPLNGDQPFHVALCSDVGLCGFVPWVLLPRCLRVISSSYACEMYFAGTLWLRGCFLVSSNPVAWWGTVCATQTFTGGASSLLLTWAFIRMETRAMHTTLDSWMPYSMWFLSRGCWRSFQFRIYAIK